MSLGCIVVHAARITLCILIPEMNKVLKEDETIKLHDLSVRETRLCDLWLSRVQWKLAVKMVVFMEVYVS